MEFIWEEAKGERNRTERGLPFDMVFALFDGFVIHQPDMRRDYGEIRMRAVGEVGELTLYCVYTDRGDMRRIISLRVANRRERSGYRSAKPK